MHFYIVDGTFYLRRWLHMPPTWQVPSSLSDLCMDSIIIPNFQNETAGPVFAEFALFFFLRTRKVSPGKSGQTFLWMTPGFRIRGSSQLKHFSKYCLKVILLRSWSFSQFPYHISLFHCCLFAESNIRLPEKTAFSPLADFIIRLSSIFLSCYSCNKDILVT